MMSWWVNTAGTQTITVNPITQKVSLSSGGTAVNPGDGEDGGGTGGGNGNGNGNGGDINTDTVSNILLYGNGCATGWSTNPNASGAIKLYTQSDKVYAWKGPLTAGQVKFHDGTRDIGAGAYTSVPGVGGEFNVTAGSGEVWNISAAGTYTVRLNLNTNKVTFTP
jgi:hypothetical protein